MIPNVSPTLLALITMSGFAAWWLGSRMRKPTVVPTVEQVAPPPAFSETIGAMANDAEPLLSCPTDHNDWQNDTTESLPPPETSSASVAPDRPLCPRCGSHQLEKRNHARKAGSTIGAVAGATSGVAMTLSGAEVGATVGMIAGPIGAVFGGLAGAILAGLAASTAGCAAGAAMGELIDDNVLGNHCCMACGYTFTASA